MPQFVIVSNFNPEPDSIHANILFWHFDSINPGQEIEITYSATLDQLPAGSEIILSNVVTVNAPGDSNIIGERANARIIAVDDKSEPKSHYDLGFSKIADKDTVFAGEEFVYTLTIVNYGPGIAYNVMLTDTMPDLITASNFNPEPDSIINNIYYWNFTSITAGQEISVFFTAMLELSLPKSLLPIKNVAGVFAPGDTNTIDNDDEAEIIASDSGVENCEDGYYFDENLFIPDKGQPLNIYFKLESSQIIQLDLYDISGYHISTIEEDEYTRGLNKFQWDGRSEQNQHIGSGVYIIALRTQNLNCWKKVIIVR